MDESKIRGMIEDRRLRWREVRAERLSLKERLLAGGLDKAAVRRDRAYRDLKKKQHRLSRMIDHLVRRLNRKIAAQNKTR